RFSRDWSSDVCSSDLAEEGLAPDAYLQAVELGAVVRAGDLHGAIEVALLEEPRQGARRQVRLAAVHRLLRVHQHADAHGRVAARSEERRGGKAWRDGG